MEYVRVKHIIEGEKWDGNNVAKIRDLLINNNVDIDITIITHNGLLCCGEVEVKTGDYICFEYGTLTSISEQDLSLIWRCDKNEND